MVGREDIKFFRREFYDGLRVFLKGNGFFIFVIREMKGGIRWYIYIVIFLDLLVNLDRNSFYWNEDIGLEGWIYSRLFDY